ncbi:cell division protein FtsQ/DivIB [Pelistega ratti]|uniref:cell division protein FtsQ/DivIB n=1 Tax=Pelistega ratti TaxID=2652177 RepID=UPI001FAA4220|nr:cell division protein FtsQ/DivIB [Pelistega ratti]
MFNNPRLANFIANIIVTVTILALLIGIGYWFVHRPMFNITQMRLEPKEGNSLQHVSPANIQSAIAGYVYGNFFTVDLPELKAHIERSPWIRHVDISRMWPNGLILRIEEHEAYAKWNENQMINTWGEIFTANREELDDNVFYPQYNGPDGSEKLMVQRAGELATLLSPLNLRIETMSLSDRYAWQVKLSNGLTLILGRDGGAEVVDPLGGSQEAVSFAENVQRFVQAWPILLNKTKGRNIIRVDLRYAKGFAITFDSVVNEESAEKK